MGQASSLFYRVCNGIGANMTACGMVSEAMPGNSSTPNATVIDAPDLSDLESPFGDSVIINVLIVSTAVLIVALCDVSLIHLVFAAIEKLGRKVLGQPPTRRRILHPAVLFFWAIWILSRFLLDAFTEQRRKQFQEVPKAPYILLEGLVWLSSWAVFGFWLLLFLSLLCIPLAAIKLIKD
ncbi:hypothetical protein Slin15195_G043550 [Septoria linicola]|uniref:Uncharacterized protein n=1 Tax=Septoria linicola TaxID=215465 RepID=A0A9Q9AS72_9PEZI|nr:hypothetical protein Slin14017_G047070 [Septoria linicola]USW51036.1 hypothetical protein Slin15195_G043550 [Septoria linicola]